MTAIEWTDVTWNPTTGCDRVSPGCDHCYAMTLAPRLKAMGSAKYQRDGDPKTSGPGFGITEHPGVVTEPLRWRKPRRVFVNSMSDLFHDGVSDDFIARVWAVMATTPEHTYQVLTKRHGRMRSLLNAGAFRVLVGAAIEDLDMDGLLEVGDADRATQSWPLPNVWLGVSVEDQKRADLRIPALLDTPAAVRFLSCEPLLGSVDLATWTNRGYCRRHRDLVWEGEPEKHPACCECGRPWNGQGIDWVIVGGESGREARPMHSDWARQLRDQCTAADVPFFFKQWGANRPVNVATPGTGWEWVETSERVGKKVAGRELDGRTWDEFPAVAS